jgi:hypothetical protein
MKALDEAQKTHGRLHFCSHGKPLADQRRLEELKSLCNEFNDGKIQYAYLKMTDETTKLVKFVFIAWVRKWIIIIIDTIINACLMIVRRRSSRD